MKAKKQKAAKLNRYERAILLLADHVERCPNCDYKVREEVMAELGFVPIKDKRKY